jgi:heat-inducible transcriptional repressor
MLDDHLDDRKAAILRVVVQEYIETAQPVGSATVAKSVPELAVSPATVRNEMSALEREGYVVQPHTSAGRVPTDKGYRFFVDSLGQPGRLDPGRSQQVRDFFAHAHGELERTLHDTSTLLSGLTNYAAVVTSPSHEVSTVRSVQLVGLGPRNVILVAVFSNGALEKRSLELPDDLHDDLHDLENLDDVTDAQLAAASAHLSAHLIGHPLGVIPKLPVTGDATVDRLTDIAVNALWGGSHDHEPDALYVGGAARMAAAFDAVDTIRQVLSILEQQYVVVSLLRDVLDSGLSVAIGTEHGLRSLAECSVVVAPYEVEGERVGTVGVLGPTRMHYEQALAAVAVVSHRLGRALTEG